MTPESSIRDLFEECGDFQGTEYKTDKYYDAYLYECEECGAQDLVYENEEFSKCIYCGANAIFKRVIRAEKLQYMIPFKVSREEAEQKIRQKVRRSLFMPRESWRVESTGVKGIYIPYLISDLKIDTEYVVLNDKAPGTVMHGICEFENLAVDAVTPLSDLFSECIEPYDMSELGEFDERRLKGCYTYIPDVTIENAKAMLKNEALELFEDGVRRENRIKSKIQVETRGEAKFGEMKSAMLPAWFITYRYEGKPYTIFMNGQTGKMAGNIPFSKIRFIFFTVLTTVVALICSALLVYFVGNSINDDGLRDIFYMAIALVGYVALFIELSDFLSWKSKFKNDEIEDAFVYRDNTKEGQ